MGTLLVEVLATVGWSLASARKSQKALANWLRWFYNPLPNTIPVDLYN